MRGIALALRVAEELRIRRRQRLRDREAAELLEQVTTSLGGSQVWDAKAVVETAEFGTTRVFLVGNQVHGLFDESPFLSVRGLLAYRPATRYVTVDMGAVKFVANGADIMAPGIVEADPALEPGAWCWVRDERNKQPLAVGKALVPGSAMVRGKGKAVRSIHYLGDKLWGAEV
ncbi:MAG: PUA domain-containing protein [Thermoplasmatota archaeon]